MSRLVSSVFKLFMNGKDKDVETAQERARNARRRGRDRTLAAADSFIFLPGGASPVNDGPNMRQRAYTSAIDDLSSSSRFSGSGSGKQLRRHARGTLRSRFSTGAAEVEDGSSRESSRCVSFMEPPVKSSSPPAQTVTICAPPSQPAPPPPPAHRTAGSPPVPRHLNYHRTNVPLPFIDSPPSEPAPPPPKPLRITTNTQTPGPTYEMLCPPGGNYCELVRRQRPTSCPDYCAPWDGKRGDNGQTLFAMPESDLDVLPDAEGLSEGGGRICTLRC